MTQKVFTRFASIIMTLVTPALSFAQDADNKPALPKIFIIGDSTAAKGNGETQQGWGEPFADYFDGEKVTVLNKALGGRSSRTFITEGHWGEAVNEFEPGDVVLIQFGHNDDGALNREPPGSTRPLRARGTIKGLGDEQEEILNAVTGKREIVRSYGYYMRKMILETCEKGAIPVLLSLTARNIWNSNGQLERGLDSYGAWTQQLADEACMGFVDLNSIMVEHFEPLGKAGMDAFYPKDHTHTNQAGADANAQGVVAGLKGLHPNPVEGWLSDKGEAVEAEEWAWLNLPVPARKGIPSLFLIGDSTVRNGRGDGSNGEWGWGNYLERYFNQNKINVVNRAVGGMSSRTFYTSEFWETVRAWIQPGDTVMIQFGHNDNAPLNDDHRARGTIKGIGQASEVIDNLITGKRETVHSYGWYLRQYVSEIRERGATPIICSMVPRKLWDGELLQRNVVGYAGWARQVAAEEGVDFVDLNNLVADRYEQMGKRPVDSLFADEHTHTNEAGAMLNAECAARGLQSLEESPLECVMTARANYPGGLHFAFTNDAAITDGFVKLDERNVFNLENGFGSDYGTTINDSGNPFHFSVAAADGNYRVTLTFGHPDKATRTTIKAESRRLMLEDVRTGPGEFVTRSIVVNVRNSDIMPYRFHSAGGLSVVLRDREKSNILWDSKLTLEINGKAPAVCSIEIEPVDVPTVYLTGDSTVTDQIREPWASWGQMLPVFFKPQVAVANHAESGRTMKGFMYERRWPKVFEHMQAGDYLFIQFGHNDQKPYRPLIYVEAMSTYKAYLKVLIEEARLRGVTPVLVTSMHRRNFDESGKIVNSHMDYPQAVQEVAASEDVALIDLHAMSARLYEAWGVETSPRAFGDEGRDKTHHNNYGAYELAKCVVQGIIDAGLPLKDAIMEEFTGFDPDKPDDLDSFYLPESPEFK